MHKTLPSVKDVVSLLHSKSEKDKALVERAYEAAQKAHEGQKRFSGEPYFIHVYETAKKLAEIGMDAPTVAAGFLHDSVEDKLVTEEAILRDFGEEVLFLVRGVTKLGKLRYQGLERHVESLRKLFIATAQDVRVLIIRLADRLHNAKTLGGHASEEKRKRIAIETLEVFVPLADRLGMGQIRGELEDAAFQYAFPKEYKDVHDLLKKRKALDEGYIKKVHHSLQKRLAESGIKTVRMDERVKHMYSLFQKLKRKQMESDKIYDIVALRLIVPTVADCYAALGVIHNAWRPLPGRIKDYIAVPKPNGYKSLHTTIFTGDGGIAEIQIRTPEMHGESEFGIASHLAYKSGKHKKQSGAIEKDLPWINQILDWQRGVSESDEFLSTLKMDFFSNRVFVFTPKGDVINLPEKSSVVDFAYAIHTDIGNHMSGARVNQKMVSLDTELKNGDIVEIQTRKDAKPSSKWLKCARTTLARKHIRSTITEDGLGFSKLLPRFGK
ncbi:MAG: RelA/SpoT family protein [Patescibacteria group bacterium]